MFYLSRFKNGHETGLTIKAITMLDYITEVYGKTNPPNLDENDDTRNVDQKINLGSVFRGPVLGFFIGYFVAILVLNVEIIVFVWKMWL